MKNEQILCQILLKPLKNFMGQKWMIYKAPNYLSQWEAINCKQITRWQHVSQLKASSFYLLVKKIIIVKNATAYTRDWYCHLVVDRASF
jgi:hypothetical protein